MKTGRQLPKVYSIQEIESIISAITNETHRLIVLITYACGLRLGEVRSLKIKDIDFDCKLIRICSGKGNKDRIVMLDDSIKPFLQKYCNKCCGQEWMFTSSFTGLRLTSRTISKIYETACDKAAVRRREVFIPYATALQRTFWKTEQISGTFRSYWDIRVQKQQRFIHMSRQIGLP